MRMRMRMWVGLSAGLDFRSKEYPTALVVRDGCVEGVTRSLTNKRATLPSRTLYYYTVLQYSMRVPASFSVHSSTIVPWRNARHSYVQIGVQVCHTTISDMVDYTTGTMYQVQYMMDEYIQDLVFTLVRSRGYWKQMSHLPRIDPCSMGCKH